MYPIGKPVRIYKSGSGTTFSLTIGPDEANDVDTSRGGFYSGWILHSVMIHISDTGNTTSFTVRFDNPDHSEPCLLKTQNMTGLTDYMWMPDFPVPRDCTVTITFTEASAKTAELEAIYSPR